MKKLFYFLVVLTMMLSCDKEKLTITNGVKDKDDTALVDDTVPVDDIETFTVEGVTFRMVKVEGGTFQMGLSYVGENCDPVHDVTLSSYYIGETEVTWGLWTAVMGSNHQYYDLDDNCPVGGVSWDDCQEFIRKLNQLTGRTFSLPTEAQWEFAARGGNKSCGYEFSGSHIIDDVAWYYDNSSGHTHPVGTRQANELGLYDMSGNVREWCRDWYGEYSSSPQTDPTGASTGKDRVLRGGGYYSGYYNDAYECRSIDRERTEPDDYHVTYGFRLVLIF